MSPIEQPECEFCSAQKPLAAVLITDSALEEAGALSENFYWLCEDHYGKIIHETDYFVREVPTPIFYENPMRQHKREEIADYADYPKTVIYNSKNPEEWLEFPDDLELDLKDTA